MNLIEGRGSKLKINIDSGEFYPFECYEYGQIHVLAFTAKQLYNIVSLESKLQIKAETKLETIEVYLDNDLIQLQTRSEKWLLKSNPSKTKAVFFTRKLREM